MAVKQGFVISQFYLKKTDGTMELVNLMPANVSELEGLISKTNNLVKTDIEIENRVYNLENKEDTTLDW